MFCLYCASEVRAGTECPRCGEEIPSISLTEGYLSQLLDYENEEVTRYLVKIQRMANFLLTVDCAVCYYEEEFSSDAFVLLEEIFNNIKEGINLYRDALKQLVTGEKERMKEGIRLAKEAQRIIYESYNELKEAQLDEEKQKQEELIKILELGFGLK